MNKIILTADQIYALAYILKAKYLDFYYISRSNKTRGNKLWLSDSTNQLITKEVLSEDFAGNTEIDPEIENVVKPIYFSTKESSLDVDVFGDDENNTGYRFHFLNGKITMVKTVEDGFEISEVTDEVIRKIVNDLISPDYSAESKMADVKLDITDVSRIFVVKNTEMNVKSTIATYVESDGIVYEENVNNYVYSVSGTDFTEKLYTILTEV